MTIWRRSGKWKRAMIARLLKRDGSLCWLCFRPMPDPPKRANKRRSLEHLNPRSLGGDDSLANLVVCHQHCNKHLADRPREQKLKMREKWRKLARSAGPARTSGR